MCPSCCHGMGGEAEDGTVQCIPASSCPLQEPFSCPALAGLATPYPSSPGDESGDGRRVGFLTKGYDGIAASPAAPLCTRCERKQPDCRRHGVTPGICPLSSAFRCSLPACPPGTARTCSAKDGDARNSGRWISHPLGSTQPCAHGWRSDDAPQVSGAALRVGDACRAMPPSTHPASGRDLGGVVGSWGQTPGLAAPHILLQGLGSGCSSVSPWCSMAVAPSRGERGTGPRAEAKCRQAEGGYRKR